MARNGSLQCSGGYCCDVSHYRDAIPPGGRSYRWQGQRDFAATAVAIVAGEGSEEVEEEEEGEEEEQRNG